MSFPPLERFFSSWIARAIFTGIFLSGIAYLILDRSLQGFAIAIEQNGKSIHSVNDSLSNINSTLNHIFEKNSAVKTTNENLDDSLEDLMTSVAELESVLLENTRRIDSIVLALKARSDEDNEYFGRLINFAEPSSPDKMEKVARYLQACDEGDSVACANLAYYYANGLEVDKDVGKAISLSKQACESDVGYGCFNLGAVYANGLGVVEQDLEEAISLFRRSCELDYGVGCLTLANMFNEGNSVAKDEVQAEWYYKRACDLGVEAGCMSHRYPSTEG